VETIRDRADNHRDRKCRDTRDGDFKIKQNTRHTNSRFLTDLHYISFHFFYLPGAKCTIILQIL